MQNMNSIQSIRELNKEATRLPIFGDISKASITKESTPFDAIKDKETLSFEEIIEAISHWFFLQFGEAEIIQAYEKFQKWAGRIYYDDYFYHQHVSYFSERFCFESLTNLNIIPFENFIESQIFNETCSPKAQEYFLSLKQRVHSLFQVVRNNKSELITRDLFTSTKYTLPMEAPSYGFEKGSVIQGFLFPCEERLMLSKGIIIHPPQVEKEIRLQIKRITKEQEHPLALLSRLARQHIIYRKQKMRDVLKIYQLDPYPIV
mgnify:CR=1 FL=1